MVACGLRRLALRADVGRQAVGSSGRVRNRLPALQHPHKDPPGKQSSVQLSTHKSFIFLISFNIYDKITAVCLRTFLINRITTPLLNGM